MNTTINPMTRIAALLLSALGGAVAAAADQTTVTFSFAPAANTRYVQTVTTLKQSDLGDLGKRIDESVSRSQVSYARRADGWEISINPLSMVMKRNGRVLDNPLLQALSSIRFAYRLDPQGQIVDVIGYEEFIEQISQQISPQVLEQLAPLLNAQTMKTKAIAEYNGRIGDFVGATMSPGQVVESKETIALPDGSPMTYHSRLGIGEREQCGGARCVRINQVYDSDPTNIARFGGKLVSNLMELVPEEISAPVEVGEAASLHGSITRLIDPASMLVHSESSVLTIRMRMKISGRGEVSMVQTEARKYSYEYQ